VARLFEESGIPVAHITSVPDMSRQVGTRRIIWGQGVPFPMGNPDLPPAQEKAFAMAQWEAALKALGTEVKEPTYFRAAFGSVIPE
jgi:betaine reductase